MANNSSNVFNIINKTKQFVYHSVFFEKKSEFVSMQKTNKMSSGVKVLLSLMFLYIVVYAFLTPCFDSGDDFVMQSIASGTYTGTPDEHLVFINVILGFFLKFLYTNTQFINWYIVVLVGLQFISLYVIFLYLKLKNVNFFIVVTSLFIAIYFIQNIQFTTISGLLCLAGMLVLNASLNNCNIKFLIVSFFFLFLSSLLRLEMALLVGLFCVIFMLIEHKEKIVTMIRTKKMIVFVVSVISSIVLASYFNYNYYQQNKEWSYFYEFNSVRGLINDNRNLDYYINNSDDSENIKAELFLIKSFHYPQNYDIKQLKILKEKISGSFKSFLINNLKNSISKYSFFLFFSLAFLIYFISKQKIWLYYVPLLFFILFYLYMNYEHIVKERIYMMLIFILFIYTLPKLNNIQIKYILFSTLITMIFSPLLYDKAVAIYMSKKISSIENTTSRNVQKVRYNTKQFVNSKNNLVIELIPTGFDGNPIKLFYRNQNVNKFNFGWLSNSPILIQQLKNRGINVKQNFGVFGNELLEKNICFYSNPEQILILNKSLIHLKKQLKPVDDSSTLYKIINL